MQEGKWLGKKTDYPRTYEPGILVAVPRKLNREIYGIRNPQDLFCGFDVWHAYEASFLTDKGLPVAGILKIVYSSQSEFLVESKSLKLYLGSFNMTSLGEDPAAAASGFCRKVKADLEALLKTEVIVVFYPTIPVCRPFDFEEYKILEEGEECHKTSFSRYQENPAYLLENRQGAGEIKVGSHLLKSNCKITRQPDWGSIYIHLKAKELPDSVALLKYIVSLRDENHFHEEICEMVFKRLTDYYQPEVLTVTCLYTRRGGIDICPSRSNRVADLPSALINPDELTASGFRQ